MAFSKMDETKPHSIEGFKKSPSTVSKQENSKSYCNGKSEVEVNADGHKKRDIAEDKSLLRSPRPRLNSVHFMASTTFAGGVLDRINYMVRCYMAAWYKNGKHGKQLKTLFCARRSVQQRIYLSIFLLTLQFILPCVPLGLFAISSSELTNASIRVTLWIFMVLELAACLWNFVFLAIIAQNYRIWKNSWFTFTVPQGTIGVIESSYSNDLTQFCDSANICYKIVNIHGTSRLDTVSLREQLKLAKVMASLGLDDAEIILHTDDYIDCYSHWPRNVSLVLLVSSGFSLILSLYFVGVSYRIQHL